MWVTQTGRVWYSETEYQKLEEKYKKIEEKYKELKSVFDNATKVGK